MKLNKFTSLLVIGLIASVAATGCRKKPVGVTDLPGSRTGTKVVTTPVVAVPDMPPGNPIKPVENPAAIPTSDNTNGTPSNPADLHKGWIEDAVALKAETVYFDFDSSVIKASEKPKAAAVADYLKANNGKAVRVEGNCDERGTEEYNRSLGER
ncbi:MAG: OmpA family protein, partial [Verrucomicrobia bacterium]|nr:OmpA family protein [Verrucomicrobiota bacterium]